MQDSQENAVSLLPQNHPFEILNDIYEIQNQERDEAHTAHLRQI